MKHLEKVKEIIGLVLGVSPSGLEEKQTLTEIGADSMDEIQITMAVEDEYDYEITDEEWQESCKTIEGICTLLEKKDGLHG
jgi:acyl carrier protein